MLNYRLIILVFLIGFLASCSHIAIPDGPPDFYVDETKVPNAIPKYEPKSRLGNKPIYYVRGQSYYVLETSKNYEAQGIASWYGTKFDHHLTSNGERYDMLKMTAAHKSLPLPTYVSVTNLTNKKQIIGKVNDRGPFHEDRLIDLSYVAAKKLGMLGHGTTWVKVKAIDLDQTIIPVTLTKPYTVTIKTKPSQVIHPATHELPIYIQIGVFKNRHHAETLKNQVHSQKIISYDVFVINDFNSPFYKVQLGPFVDNNSAKHAATLMRKKGYTAIIVK